MKKSIPHTVARPEGLSREAFVGLWTLGLWALAAVYLLATFSVR